MPPAAWINIFSPTLRRAGFAAAILVSGCSQISLPPPPPSPRDSGPGILQLQAISYARLPGWRADSLDRAVAPFLRSCRKLLVRAALRPLGTRLLKAAYAGRVQDWWPVCRAAKKLGSSPRSEKARRFFERWFQPYIASDQGHRVGLFTGYFEPLLQGSRTRSARYSVPLYRRPPDLIGLTAAGKPVQGRMVNGRFAPYYARAEIRRGALSGRGLELLWVDDPVDAFFLHIQGSGRVALENGEVLRVGFAGRNGQPYLAIGRELVKRGELAKERVSLQSIRAWLARHPGQAAQLMDMNRSYIFFKLVQAAPGNGPIVGPIGAQGVQLTPGRSLAVDRRFVPLGVPVWLTATHPLRPGQALRRLVIAQDTGGAITGPVRGDLFWGAGPTALAAAGRMKEAGEYYLLLPRSLRRPGS